MLFTKRMEWNSISIIFIQYVYMMEMLYKDIIFHLFMIDFNKNGENIMIFMLRTFQNRRLWIYLLVESILINQHIGLCISINKYCKIKRNRTSIYIKKFKIINLLTITNSSLMFKSNQAYWKKINS